MDSEKLKSMTYEEKEKRLDENLVRLDTPETPARRGPASLLSHRWLNASQRDAVQHVLDLQDRMMRGRGRRWDVDVGGGARRAGASGCRVFEFDVPTAGAPRRSERPFQGLLSGRKRQARLGPEAA
jgi:hypothetical protein